jgi:predicted Ser/Thr protein kinase
MTKIDKKSALLLWGGRKFFAKGKRGMVYTCKFRGKTFLLKEKSCGSTAFNSIALEAENNVKLNAVGVGPKFCYYDAEKDFLVREFVDGQPLMKWVEFHKNDAGFKEKLLGIIINILDQCRKMDSAFIGKKEMTNPYKDILVRGDGVPVIIDFERCRHSVKPKNVTQFCQFLSKGRMTVVLSYVEVRFGEELLVSANNYKKSYSEESFSSVKKCVEGRFTPRLSSSSS